MKRATLFAVILLFLVLSPGCGSIDVQQFKADAAGIADGVLDEAEWYQCYGASVGSIRRKYADDPVRLGAWQTICHGSNSNIFTPPMIPVATDDPRTGY